MVQKKLGDYGKKGQTYRARCETCRLYRTCPRTLAPSALIHNSGAVPESLRLSSIEE